LLYDLPHIKILINARLAKQRIIADPSPVRIAGPPTLANRRMLTSRPIAAIASVSRICSSSLSMLLDDTAKFPDDPATQGATWNCNVGIKLAVLSSATIRKPQTKGGTSRE